MPRKKTGHKHFKSKKSIKQALVKIKQPNLGKTRMLSAMETPIMLWVESPKGLGLRSPIEWREYSINFIILKLVK